MSKVLDELTPDELRLEVMNCHEHMRRCCDVLDGKDDVEPVELADVSDSMDLELFYKCKQAVAGPRHTVKMNL